VDCPERWHTAPVTAIETKVPAARWLTVLVGTFSMMCPWASSPGLSLALCIAFLTGAALVIATLTRLVAVRDLPVRPLLWLMAAVTACGVVVTSGITLAAGANPPLVIVLTVVLLALGVGGVFAVDRPRRHLVVLAGVAWAVLVVLYTTTWDWVIDVDDFLVGGMDALLRGQSPYAITVPDIYPAEVSNRIYGSGIVQDGRIAYGFAYLPAPLLLDLPAHLLGDPVWMHALVVAGGVCLAWTLASDRLARAAVVVLAASPSTPVLIANYWVESLMIGFLVLAVWGMQRASAWPVVVGMGILFSTKQYAIYVVPAVWSVARRAGLRVALGGGALAALVVVPVALMDVHAFWRSAVSFQLDLPFRVDAVSFLPAARLVAGDLPPWLYVVLPVLGLGVSALVAWRTRPGPTAFALGLGLGLLVTVVFSKQSFFNYFAFIGAALLMAGVTWPLDDPVRPRQTREPSSQGSRGERGISSTR
jgi:hypothetical protein